MWITVWIFLSYPSGKYTKDQRIDENVSHSNLVWKINPDKYVTRIT